MNFDVRIGSLASGIVWKRCAALGVVSLTMLAACGGGGASDRASSASPPTTLPPTLARGVSDTCPGFRGSTSVLTSRGPSAPAVLVDATAGAQGCLDVVTLSFRSLGDGTPPSYTVGYEDPARAPFLDGDPPTPISVPGAAFLVIRAQPASSSDPFAADAAPSYTGNLSLDYGDHHHLQIVRKLPDTKGAVVWVIGLDGVRPFRVDRAANPPRISVYIG